MNIELKGQGKAEGKHSEGPFSGHVNCAREVKCHWVF